MHIYVDLWMISRVLYSQKKIVFEAQSIFVHPGNGCILSNFLDFNELKLLWVTKYEEDENTKYQKD